jgi:hypothetical protein
MQFKNKMTLTQRLTNGPIIEIFPTEIKTINLGLAEVQRCYDDYRRYHFSIQSELSNFHYTKGGWDLNWADDQLRIINGLLADNNLILANLVPIFCRNYKNGEIKDVARNSGGIYRETIYTGNLHEVSSPSHRINQFY